MSGETRVTVTGGTGDGPVVVDPATGPGEVRWVDAVGVDELRRAKRTVVEIEGTPICLVWHDDAPWALHDLCIHKQRSLAKGVVLNGRLVCPGHQWAFELGTGWCRERERAQPAFAARVEGDRVEVDLSAPRPAPG